MAKLMNDMETELKLWLRKKYHQEVTPTLEGGVCFIDLQNLTYRTSPSNAKYVSYHIMEEKGADILILASMFDKTTLMKFTIITPLSVRNTQLHKIIEKFFSQIDRCVYSKTDKQILTSLLTRSEIEYIITYKFLHSYGISDTRFEIMKADTNTSALNLKHRGIQSKYNAKFLKINGWCLEHRSSSIEYCSEDHSLLGEIYSVPDEKSLLEVLKRTMCAVSTVQTTLDLQNQIDALEIKINKVLKKLYGDAEH